VSLAARGARDLDQGAEPVRDRAEREASRERARGVFARAVILAAGLTVLSLLLP
jgi:hypothetical protein